ncbi:heavy-metal-associated domain-containing protein [Leucobacter sp.]
MTTYTFRVEYIHCGGCENAIRKALTRLGGVSDVAPDSATNEVTVSYDDSQTSTEQIAERLATAGYPVIG